MADQNTATEDQNEGGNAPDNGGEGDENTNQENQGGDESSANAEGGEEGDEGEEGEGDDINADEEPATRSNHNAIHAQKRIANKQNKGNQNSDEGGEGGGKGDEGGDDDEGGDQKPDPTDIEGAVAKALKPFTDKMVEKETEDEVNNYINENPDFKPYAKKILNFAKHPTRVHLPIETVALEAIGKKGLLQIGAKRAKEADAEGKQTQSGGTSTRNAPSGKSVKDMSKEEFEAEQNKVRFGQ